MIQEMIQEFNLIDDGDKIAVALSGGKDSISLSLALKALQRFYPKKFTISAFCIPFTKRFLPKHSQICFCYSKHLY